MRIPFHKYHGTGNDFILVDNREGIFREDKETIQRLCDRHFGIGSDGLILIESDSEADFYMNFFNPDGSQSFCGNGSRCAVAFFHQVFPSKETIRFRAIDGMHSASVASGIVSISMSDVNEIREAPDGWFLNTGSPHIIRFVDSLGELDIVKEARAIRYNERWKEKGVNVNFVSVTGSNRIRMRTYERGVEAETLSCGTGVTAAALAFHYLNKSDGRIEVETAGGRLSVLFVDDGSGLFREVQLIGPATPVFEGHVTI